MLQTLRTPANYLNYTILVADNAVFSLSPRPLHKRGGCWRTIF